MAGISIDLSKSGIDIKNLLTYKEQVENIHKDLNRRANDEKDFVGWLELPTNYDIEEFERIKEAAKRIKKDSDILVVIGIGGSYLGSKACIDLLSNYYSKDDFEVIFLGNDMSSSRLHETLEHLKDVDFWFFEMIIVIIDRKSVV